MSDDLLGVFVYGTLKRGQCRETCWPVSPRSVSEAWTRGTLYSRADYPALQQGVDRVLGELWCFPPKELEVVVEVLDRVEQTRQPGLPDLYLRVMVPVWSLEGGSLGKALSYHYAGDPLVDGFHRLEPGPDDCVSWGCVL